tara:strand:- start:1296 stop:1496 length:201 start_codon:yes stop_codon:yes gene_type:complete
MKFSFEITGSNTSVSTEIAVLVSTEPILIKSGTGPGEEGIDGVEGDPTSFEEVIAEAGGPVYDDIF